MTRNRLVAIVAAAAAIGTLIVIGSGSANADSNGWGAPAVSSVSIDGSAWD